MIHFMVGRSHNAAIQKKNIDSVEQYKFYIECTMPIAHGQFRRYELYFGNFVSAVIELFTEKTKTQKWHINTYVDPGEILIITVNRYMMRHAFGWTGSLATGVFSQFLCKILLKLVEWGETISGWIETKQCDEHEKSSEIWFITRKIWKFWFSF